MRQGGYMPFWEGREAVPKAAAFVVPRTRALQGYVIRLIIVSGFESNYIPVIYHIAR